MRKQYIFEVLSEAEFEMFYLYHDNRHDENAEQLKEAHEAIRKAIELYTKATGIGNKEGEQ